MKKAFTLAEVLLTLGIIGIVAAITIPTLTKAYQRKVLEVQAKKSYSLLNQALQMTIEDNGAEYKCFTTNNRNETESSSDYSYSECHIFWSDYFKHLKVVGEKETGKKVVLYKSKAEVLSAGGSVSNNSCSFSFGYNGQFTKYYLNDGQVIYLNPQRTSALALFAILDINGETGPNKWGYDVFYITPSKRKNGSIRMYESECYIKEKDGKYLSEIIFNKPSTKWLFPD